MIENPQRMAQVLEDERNEEREACAHMAEEWARHRKGDSYIGMMSLAMEIRARGSVTRYSASNEPVFDEKGAKCPGSDPTCPCRDGDSCHYRGENPWPIQTSATAQFTDNA